MRVRLLSHTENAERLCAAAAHSCYSDRPAGDILDNIDDMEWEKVLKGILSMGHHSVIEHASYTFSLEGVSRVLTHQLVRHRLASYAQQSMRYVELDVPSYVIPSTIEEDEDAKRRFHDLMERIWEEYRLLSEKVPIEDARYILPNAATTNITVTMNARELWHFFSLRTCRRAQWELREAAEEMLRQVREVSPLIFKSAGPPCVRGKCPEGKKSCGRPRTELIG